MRSKETPNQRTKPVWITPEAQAQLEALRVRAGIVDGPDGRGETRVVEWLIRAMTEQYARIDRENAADAKTGPSREV